jgi:hypothetical protein
VLTGDDETSLAARVLKAEHGLYALALKLVAEGKVSMVDGKSVFSATSRMVENGDQAIMSPAALRDDVDLEALARFTP